MLRAATSETAVRRSQTPIELTGKPHLTALINLMAWIGTDMSLLCRMASSVGKKSPTHTQPRATNGNVNENTEANKVKLLFTVTKADYVQMAT
jgi:hypothetical protein